MRRAGAVGVLNFEGPLGRQHIFNCAAAVGPAVRERRATVGPRRQVSQPPAPPRPAPIAGRKRKQPDLAGRGCPGSGRRVT